MGSSTFLWIFGGAIGAFCIYRFVVKNKQSTSKRLTEGPGHVDKKSDVEPVHKPKPWDNFDKTVSAKECIATNIDLFAPLIQNLHEGIDSDAWVDAIITTKNFQLIDYWSKIKNNPQAWETLLQMWGVKCDTCTSFIGMDSYKNMYDTEDGTEIEEGIRYSVIRPCWILTRDNDNGQATKTLISKGLVKKE